MSNKDKMEKLAEINTAVDQRVDPWLLRVANSKYTVPILLVIFCALLAVGAWMAS